MYLHIKDFNDALDKKPAITLEFNCKLQHAAYKKGLPITLKDIGCVKCYTESVKIPYRIMFIYECHGR